MPEMLEDAKRQLFGKLIRQFQSFFDALHVIQLLSKIKDDIQVVSKFPFLLGHPVPNLWFWGLDELYFILCIYKFL